MSKQTFHKFTDAGFSKRLATIKPYIKRAYDNVENLHVKISNGNTKLGNIPSVSLLPVFDCGNCAACKHSCYDLRSDMIYKETICCRATNSAIYATNPERYFHEMEAWLTVNYPRAFRWHIGGDIKDVNYYRGMVKIAKNFPDIRFLCFTKQFRMLNTLWINEEYHPENLQIIFSGWPGLEMENPFGAPSAHPIFADGTTSAHDGAKLCTGNCTDCLREKKLCWTLGNMEEIVFPAH